MIFWIASYPKSGNTWLRALISSYYYSPDGIFDQKLLAKIGQFPERAHFSNFNYDPKIVTDTTNFWIQAQDKINRDKKIKFFKTHNLLGSVNNNKFTDKKNTIGGIYIVRDPRNVITSIQNHFELSKDDALKFMLNEKKFIYDYHLDNDYSNFQFISSWEKNYQSWFQQNLFPIKIVKYEDLNDKTFEIFKEIVNFIERITKNKKSFDTIKAKNSIQSTAFNKMKNLEKNDGFIESVLSKNDPQKIPFFHLGPNNDWKKIFDKNYKEKLKKIFDVNLKELNY